MPVQANQNTNNPTRSYFPPILRPATALVTFPARIISNIFNRIANFFRSVGSRVYARGARLVPYSPQNQRIKTRIDQGNFSGLGLTQDMEASLNDIDTAKDTKNQLDLQSIKHSLHEAEELLKEPKIASCRPLVDFLVEAKKNLSKNLEIAEKFNIAVPHVAGRKGEHPITTIEDAEKRLSAAKWLQANAMDYFTSANQEYIHLELQTLPNKIEELKNQQP